MSERSSLRLLVLQVLVLSLLMTLLARLWYLQVIAGDQYQAASSSNSVRSVITPALRGAILDDQGRPLVENRTTVVVTVDRTVLAEQKDDGESVLRALALVLGEQYQDLYDRTRLCGTEGAKKPPICWYGSPYQPIPVAKDVPVEVELAIRERQENFPGVTTELEALRDYRQLNAVNAAHILGYLGPASGPDRRVRGCGCGRRSRADLRHGPGRASTGLEAQYDDYLRGSPGSSSSRSTRPATSSTRSPTPATAGRLPVTSIDARVQAVAEQQVAAAIKRAPRTGDVNKPGSRSARADSGAVVVMDVRTGRIVAMASYPTYDPSIWVGGISTQQGLRRDHEQGQGLRQPVQGVQGRRRARRRRGRHCIRGGCGRMRIRASSSSHSTTARAAPASFTDCSIPRAKRATHWNGSRWTRISAMQRSA